MAPNIYVAVTMVQPHAGKDNDRPIRLYGVIPLKVTDPATKLTPDGGVGRRVGAEVQGHGDGERDPPAAPWTTRWPSSMKAC